MQFEDLYDGSGEFNRPNCQDLTVIPTTAGLTQIMVHGSQNLTSIEDQPDVTLIYAHGCESLTSIGNCPNLETIFCHGCPSLTAFNTPYPNDKLKNVIGLPLNN